MSTPTLPSKPKKILVGLQEDRERSRQLDVHRAAIFVLTQKDRPIPSLQEMKDDLAKDEYTSIKERITSAKANHKENLERIYAAHAEDYLDDQRLRRESREDYGQMAGDGMSSKLAEWSEKRDPISSTDLHYSSSLSHSVTTEMARYTNVIHSLYLRKAEIEQQLEEERRRRDAAFPLTLEEFHAKPRDIQIRVANFLNADSARKDRMMTEFNWAWRQVEGLVREFSSNDEFKGEVMRLLETVESRDPRRKR